jgi:hypothetical protein
MEFGTEQIEAFAERYTRQLIDLGYESDPEWHLSRIIQAC